MNEERTCSISEVAERTGLSTDTLRYYEKIGLLASPKRGGGQKRMYDEEDIGRIRFLNHLRKTDMPLKNIKEYVQHYSQKDYAHCYALLDSHREAIEGICEGRRPSGRAGSFVGQSQSRNGGRS